MHIYEAVPVCRAFTVCDDEVRKFQLTLHTDAGVSAAASGGEGAAVSRISAAFLLW